jgi:hypothetical protein
MPLNPLLITDSFKDWFDNHNAVVSFINAIVSVLEIDTSATTAGLFGYINASGVIAPALADVATTYSDCYVVSSSASGLAVQSGSITATVEGVLTIVAGDVLYLSDSEAGKVTNVAPTNAQILGKATAGSSLGTVSMWYNT